MKHLSRIVVVGVLLAALLLLIVPISAQDPAPGEGGVIITDNIGDDPTSFNPLIGNDNASSTVYSWLYPSIVGVDVSGGAAAPNDDDSPYVTSALAESWEFDETGTVMTLQLRDDMFWNDGTPITANDWVWALDAVRSGETSSPRTNIFATLADGSEAGGSIADYRVIDDYTVEVTLSTADCDAITDLNDVAVVPSHIWEELYGDNYAAMDEEPRRIPEVTYGPLKDIEFEPGARVSLVADQNYTEGELGFVAPSEWVYLNVADQNVALERFLAGEISYTTIPLANQNELRDNPDFNKFEYSANSITFIGYNLADPENPLDGLDEEGNVQDQGIHPIFGDVAVRQALNHAIDIDAMIDGILEGNGIRADTYALPTWWVFADIEPRAYDPDLALEILAEAGWVDDDGDVSTPLVCQGCLYAETVDSSFEGSPFSFTLSTNAGNVTREAIGETIQAQLGDIGVEVNYQAIDFGVLVDELLGQTFDAIIIGFGGGEVTPGSTYNNVYAPSQDTVGAGFNFTSYYNEEVMELLEQGKDPNQTDGCSFDGRRPFYEEAQRIFNEELPWTYLFVANVMFAWPSDLAGPDPQPFDGDWNIDAYNYITSN